MRILIDECIDERFRNFLPDHDCQTARYAGLAGLKNGELLTAAETAKFDRPKYRNNHFSHEVEPSERPVAARNRLPRVH